MLQTIIIHNFDKQLEYCLVSQLKKLVSTHNYLIGGYCGEVKSANQSPYISVECSA